MGVVALVGLRVVIGWHFANEGLTKIQSKNFRSDRFLSAAKGPLAGWYRSLAWDADGSERLGHVATDRRPIIEPKASFERIGKFRQEAEAFYDYDAAQIELSRRVETKYASQLKDLFDEHHADLFKYFAGLERQSEQAKHGAFQGVDSLSGQAAKLNGEQAALRNKLVGAFQQFWEAYELDLAFIASDDPDKTGKLSFLWPGEPEEALSARSIDRFIPWFDLVVGGLLLVGLFTRLAAAAGAAFLLLVIGSQWPGAPGAIPVYYESVETFGLLLLAALGAGRYCGLDYFGYCLTVRTSAPTEGMQSQ